MVLVGGAGGSDASGPLLCVAAQDLQAQGDVIDPSQRVDADVAAEERWVKDGERFLIRIIVSLKNLRNKEVKEEGTGVDSFLITEQSKWK